MCDEMRFSEITFLDGRYVEFRDMNNRAYLTVYRKGDGIYENRKGSEYDLETWRLIAANMQ